jgi:hypothetical protein
MRARRVLARMHRHDRDLLDRAVSLIVAVTRPRVLAQALESVLVRSCFLVVIIASLPVAAGGSAPALPPALPSPTVRPAAEQTDSCAGVLSC